MCAYVAVAVQHSNSSICDWELLGIFMCVSVCVSVSVHLPPDNERFYIAEVEGRVLIFGKKKITEKRQMVQHCADVNCAHSFVVYVYVANGGYMVGAINDSGQCCEAAYRQGTCVCV